MVNEKDVGEWVSKEACCRGQAMGRAGASPEVGLGRRP